MDQNQADVPAPKRIGPLHEVTLTGKMIAWIVDRPVVLRMPGTNARYLPVFSLQDDLCRILDRCQITGYSVKNIDDGPDFLSSLVSVDAEGNPLHVILDPYFTSDDRLHFGQVIGRD